ncbi:MAG: UDP-N-acetylmuramoyl-L-alanine--D-glutamate ligase [Flavobacteriales bacterium]|nr:UDP-N-acetylmuramoyl-L-alanine--D-glutamate ligase [Flavobacteriales bacterium]
MKKRIVVIGGGESGVGAAILAKKKGFDVFLSDGGSLKEKYKTFLQKHNINFEEGEHNSSIILSADEIIKSPGVSYEAEIIQSALAEQIPVISEIEFAGRYTNAVIIGITGTNGKTTTTHLTHHLLKRGGLNVKMAGNVGNSFAYEVATSETDIDYYVLELSSFQLDGIVSFHPHIVVMTNITPDHLDRYKGSFQSYIDAKFKIAERQEESDYFIYCYDDKVTREEVEKRKIKSIALSFSIQTCENQTACVQNNIISINLKNDKTDMMINELALQGKHNLYNSMAAAIVARLSEVSKESIRESLSDFENIEHRMEFVAKVKGIDFINDSKATNVNSAWYALECMHNPVIWIVGGVDKGNDYSMLKSLVKDKVKSIICLGKDNKKIIKSFGDIVENIVETDSMLDAVKIAYRIGQKNDIVLLSPACASFDLFENYEERGREFKRIVREL